jgi:hypothetical protein
VQPLARNGLTSAQIIALIRDSSSPEFSSGLELIGLDLNMTDDLTDDFDGGTVERANYATLHGSATLQVARELDWGTAIVRPYTWLTGYTTTYGTLTARFNLGAYLTNTPKSVAGKSPATHEVEAVDILHWLNTPVGEAYTVEAGTGYLDAIEAIFIAQGLVSYFIDRDQTAQVLDAPRSWAFDDHTTWLNICNDLAGAVGYQGIWSDWDGRLRVQPYLVPSDRSIEWTYTDDPSTSMIAPERAIVRDWFDAPNRWVFYWNKDPAEAPPIAGAGLYVFVNQFEGPTSVAARGRVISAKPQQIDVVDHNALVARAQQSIDADMRLKTTYELATFPNPASWHFDKYTLADSGLGPISDVLGVKWSLPLDGSNMVHEWSMI